MPTYRVKELSFIGNTLRQPGEEVEYDHEPGPNLEPTDKPAAAAAAEVKKVPKAVAEFVNQVRQHAATRGVPPDQVNAGDFDAVLGVLPNKPSRATVDAAAKALGVDLAASVA